MVYLVSLADIRDVFIIIYAVLGILLFVLAIGLVIGLYFAFRSLRSTVRDLVDESVKPTLGSIRDTAESIKGTTEFVGEKAVSPIIRTYSMAAGVRKGLGVLTGIARRKEE